MLASLLSAALGYRKLIFGFTSRVLTFARAHMLGWMVAINICVDSKKSLESGWLGKGH
jgi:hypothetical protein